MSQDFLATVESRLAEVQSKFDVLEKERKSLAENRAAVDRRLNEIVTAQVELRGSFATLTELKKEADGSKPTASSIN